MGSDRFDFQQFSIQQDRCAMKVGIDAVVLGTSAEIPSFCYHALDIGTGTGILALMLAQRSPATAVDAVENEPSAATQAAENVAASPFASQVTVHQTAIQAFRPKHTYDLIICNPPYFSDSLPSPNAARQQARHTTTLSHADLLASVARLLNPTGSFWTILPFEGHLAFVRTANSYHLKPAKQIRVAPFPDKSPNRIILQFTRFGSRVSVETLTIRQRVVEQGQPPQYTEQFRTRSAEFYLR